ncbi:hypothetical protein GCM10010112_75580 [Actinoplanes lobatus]|uniref:Uncharacterized protein n=1 Tax=Actinoplanes lobatus TaxID=113568 RepID=A0A7W7HHB5_9ACTN|nr:hypothetical protein [Actinoplanes lobatus]MBB4750509.1 hypothetical protein [Actinoplanes lobatus]GGN90302.1 hypothetical protein GCM10010112_75580 [Actinoplanes lobatus]GIE43814.1 hypothetical protein Alo02nite_67120 [Actinoplanes lobatus]
MHDAIAYNGTEDSELDELLKLVSVDEDLQVEPIAPNRINSKYALLPTPPQG